MKEQYYIISCTNKRLRIRTLSEQRHIVCYLQTSSHTVYMTLFCNGLCRFPGLVAVPNKPMRL